MEYKNRPVTNVTWFEAQAFTKWLTKKIQVNVQLPNEVQWEKAARGCDARIYPWGNDPKEFDANIKEANLHYLTPVGTFNTRSYWEEECPNEMVGNIWEWCSTSFDIDNSKGKTKTFKYPYNYDDGREDIISVDEKCNKVTRGGYFRYDALLSRCSFRGRDNPHERLDRQGFRIVKI